jgi:hypothetical protein
MRAKLIKLYASATEEQRQQGAAWYNEGREWCRAVAVEHGRSTSCVAGIVAALSPRLSWARNKELASKLLAGVYTNGAFAASMRKARAIVAGAKPLLVLGGQKVRSFYLALIGHTSAAVIDVWILRALGLSSVTDKLYARISSAMALASSALGVSVRDLQATIWVKVRGSAQ